MDITSN